VPFILPPQAELEVSVAQVPQLSLAPEPVKELLLAHFVVIA